jgi:DNA-binding NarL/FixJ family response regulator
MQGLGGATDVGASIRYDPIPSWVLSQGYQRRRVSGETMYMASLLFPTRVLVVDDYEPWRRFFSTTLEKEPELQVIGQVSDGLEAARQAQQLQPDLILLDIGLPTLNGIEAARRIREVSPASKILFVSENRSLDIVEKALSTGRGGYVVKSDAGNDLLPAVEAVLQGKRFVSSSLWGCDDEHTTKQARRERIVAPARPQSVERNRHELTLCSDDAAFVDDFAHSIEAALESGNAVVVIATESHRANLLQQLRADGVDVDAAAERKLYIPLDVFGSFPTVMDTSSDGDGFAKGVSHVIIEALRTAKERHLHLAVG